MNWYRIYKWINYNSNLIFLLIGLAVNDIQGLQREGIVKRLRKQAQFILDLEGISCKPILKFIFRINWLQSKMMKWLELDPTIVIYPTRRKQPTINRLSSSIVQQALAIKQGDCKPTVDNLYKTLSY